MKTHEAIKYLRMALLLNQTEFGKLIGVTYYAVLNWENQHRRPRLPQIKKMLSVAKENNVNITFEDFLNN